MSGKTQSQLKQQHNPNRSSSKSNGNVRYCSTTKCANKSTRNNNNNNNDTSDSINNNNNNNKQRCATNLEL